MGAAIKLSWSLPIERLSTSSISLFVTCPEQWRQRYLFKQEEKLFGDRFIGLVDHSTHEAALNYKLATKKNLTDEELKLTFGQEWTRLIDRDGEPDWRDDDPSKMYDRALAAVALYHEQVGKQLEPVAVEEWFEFTVPSVPVPVVGKLDVLCSDRVIDRKTSKTKLSKPKGKWRLQAKLYSHATGLPVEYQIITKQATPQIVTAVDAPELMIQPASKASVELLVTQAAKMLNDYYARYGKDQSWPTWGILHDWACDYCRYSAKYEGTCPAWRS